MSHRKLFSSSNTKNGLLIVLIIVNILSALAAFMLALKTTFPDAKGYWLMSDSLFWQKFSSWYTLDHYYPETLRTPGYPIFLWLLRSIYDSEMFIKIVQLGLYFFSLLLAFKVLTRLSNHYGSKVLFLAFTIINIQIPYYAGYISCEALNIFALTLYVYMVVVLPRSTGNALAIGITAGILYLIRPAFILFPFIFFLYGILFYRQNLKYHLITISIYCITLLPFSLWNYANHQQFKPTPLEGGAGLAHYGYWTFLLPDGYIEHFYWSNTVGYDFTNPISKNNSDSLKNIKSFEQEWNTINSNIEPLLTDIDKQSLSVMKGPENPGIFPIYNSRYTQEREKLLWKATINHIKKNPIFYFKTRIYTFLRLYFTGINSHDLKDGISIKAIYPFLITFLCILGGLIFSSVCLFVYRKTSLINYNSIFLYMLIVYYGLVHITFTIQSRYTVVVHFFILLLISVFTDHLLSKTVFKKNSLSEKSDLA